MTDDNIALQAKHHPLVYSGRFTSLAEYGTHLMHVRAYEEASRLMAGRSVLDVGCNNGHGTSILARTAESTVGIDVSPRAIAAARRQWADQGNLRFEVYDGIRLPFAGATFGGVTCLQVIEHIENVDSFLHEIAQTLVPQGIAFFTTPNARIRLHPGMRPWNRFHVREYTGAELYSVLRQYFDAVEILGMFASPELYDAERRRCAMARRVGSLPLPVRSALLMARQAIRRIKPMRSAEKWSRYTTQDYFYRGDETDDALDLLAICRPRAKA